MGMKTEIRFPNRNSYLDGRAPLTSEISDMANKILFQFDNFSDYTRTEVKKILNDILDRESRGNELLQDVTNHYNLFKASIDQFCYTAN